MWAIRNRFNNFLANVMDCKPIFICRYNNNEKSQYLYYLTEKGFVEQMNKKLMRINFPFFFLNCSEYFYFCKKRKRNLKWNKLTSGNMDDYSQGYDFFCQQEIAVCLRIISQWDNQGSLRPVNNYSCFAKFSLEIVLCVLVMSCQMWIIPTNTTHIYVRTAQSILSLSIMHIFFSHRVE